MEISEILIKLKNRLLAHEVLADFNPLHGCMDGLSLAGFQLENFAQVGIDSEHRLLEQPCNLLTMKKPANGLEPLTC